MHMRKLLLGLMAFLLFTGQLLAQKTITGKVTDDKGNPIPNASVVVKGSTAGTTTKADGSYTLTVPSNATTLVVSSIGSQDQELAIGSNSVVNFSLTSTTQDLGEVIVTVPYGTIKKTAFTGSEATVSAAQINRQQVTSITKTLEGLVPGIITTNGGGAPGSNASVLIRGIGSINASSSPLYVLNGVPYDGPIAAINNDDVESVSILKDAAAAALYGSRAANGVIMITTKRGKKGRAAVTASVRQGYMSRGIPEYDRLDEKEFYELNWESIRNGFVATGDSYATAGTKASAQLTDGSHLVYNAYNQSGANLIDPTTGKLNPAATLLWNESWEDALFRTAPRTNATVNISGASDRSDYFISLGYLNEEGTLRNSDYKRYNMRVNLNAQATNWMKVGMNIDGALSNNNSVINGGTATSNPFYYTRQMGPIYPVYQHDPITGAFIQNPITGENELDWGIPSQMGTRPYAGNSNLVGSLALDQRYTKRLSGNGNAYIEIKPTKDFTFKTNFGVNLWDDNGTTYQNNQYGDADNVSGRSTKQFDRQVSYTFNQVLSYNKEIGEHDFTVLAGHENYFYRYNNLNLTRTGFQFPGQTELDNAALTESVGGSYEDNQTIESYFGGLNYSFKEKYLASASLRRDGSSRFSPDARWGTFYSAGLGWRISQEEFLKNVNWLSELKLKASYGEQGVDNIGLLYQYTYYYNANGSGGYNPQAALQNPDLKWETSKTLNAGFDFGLFKNRITGTIEYFRRISDDLLFNVPRELSSGSSSQYQNIGTMKNSGIEVSLGLNIIRKRDFDWRIDVNVTHFKNEVTKLPPAQRENGIIRGTKKLSEGHSIYDYWIREFAGVDASNGDALYYKDVLGTDGKPTGTRLLTNNITEGSFYYKGTAIPDFNGGLTNSFRYKAFELSILTTFSYGGKFYDGNYAGIMHSGSYGIAWSQDILNRWQKPGDLTNVPRLQNTSISTQDGLSTRFLMDASYVNLKNITLSYAFAKSITNRLGISGAQFFGNVDNAYIFTAKKGMDPQRSFDGSSDATYPPFRTITFGVTLNL
ncbi:MAG: TonB-dependent receptor [Chitinophagaceae bacterium]|nr:MAG: TonB-dependent receptor [Chitinophagaceae bacterium]